MVAIRAGGDGARSSAMQTINRAELVWDGTLVLGWHRKIGPVASGFCCCGGVDSSEGARDE